MIMENKKEHHHHKVSGKNLGWSILLNVAITVAEASGGIISGNMATDNKELIHK